MKISWDSKPQICKESRSALPWFRMSQLSSGPVVVVLGVMMKIQSGVARGPLSPACTRTPNYHSLATSYSSYTCNLSILKL